MNFLFPIGLAALSGIAVILIIHLIRPSYKNTRVSSTYIWKLSLRHKTKTPITKLRSLLLFLCQALVVAAFAVIIARPMLVHHKNASADDVIIVVDSSASMTMQSGGVSRFDRAVDLARKKCEDTLDAGGRATVVVAGERAEIAVAAANNYEKLDAAFNSDKLKTCYYGASDMTGAAQIVSEYFDANPAASAFIYTDTQYPSIADTVNIVTDGVLGTDEYNSGIVNARAEYDKASGAYYVEVTLAAYGANALLRLDVAAHNTVADSVVRFGADVDVGADGQRTIVFYSGRIPTAAQNVQFVELDDSQKITVFDYMEFNISYRHSDDDDAFAADDTFVIYGGRKQPAKVLYSSSRPSILTQLALSALKVESPYDIDIVQMQSAAVSGYDVYLFEGMNNISAMPKDGIVIFLDPQGAVPKDAGFTVGGEKPLSAPEKTPVTAAKPHPLISGMNIDTMIINSAREIVVGEGHEDEYETVLECNGMPLLLYKNSGNSKVVISAISVHTSDMVMNADLALMMFNIFELLLPPLSDRYCAYVGESVALASRGNTVTVAKDGTDKTTEVGDLPAAWKFTEPGSYTISCVTDFGKRVEHKLFVRVPTAECDIFPVGERLAVHPGNPETITTYEDIFIYFAIALVALICAEWILQMFGT